MGILFLIFLVMVLGIVAVYISQKNKKQPEQHPQPSHFDLLDENCAPIKKPKVKIVMGGGDSDAPIQELQYFCIKDKGYHVSVWPKDQVFQGLDYIEFNIAGIIHGEYVDEHLGEFVATLVPDPTNPYDANAIKIMTDNGHRVGYVPRDTTGTIREFTTLPCQCYCFIGNNDGIYFSDCYITKN